MNDFGSLTGNCLKDNDGSNEDCNTKKVRFKEVDGNLIENMVVDVASLGFDSRVYWGFCTRNGCLKKIGGLVGKVAKIDIKMDSGARGQFARIAVFVDLEKSLTSQVLINGKIQRVEFEALPTNADDGQGVAFTPVVNRFALTKTEEAFGPWMIFRHKSRCNQTGNRNQEAKTPEKIQMVSKFAALKIDSARFEGKYRGSKAGLVEKENMGKMTLGQSNKNGPEKSVRPTGTKTNNNKKKLGEDCNSKGLGC
ncbi:hypothetical protein GOBAR_AA22017 [Gossypium barbadense]|uniref:DUF4283 domain-containing protein n=1 Tax=Gossypium barbadense TaxID=3634 RepID=A0A2P5X5P9_GOSBA|nr:hypothetical protein GOBAR_AA22017 [Gossypium barbadense]